MLATDHPPSMTDLPSVVPASVVGNGETVADCIVVARLEPNEAAITSGARAEPLKLAAETLARLAEDDERNHDRAVLSLLKKSSSNCATFCRAPPAAGCVPSLAKSEQT